MSNTEVSAKEFGALQAKVEYIKDGVDRHTAALERIEKALNKNVSQAVCLSTPSLMYSTLACSAQNDNFTSW